MRPGPAAFAIAALAAGSGGCLPAAPSPCGDGLSFCDPHGTFAPFCVDLGSDLRNCGSCGAICPWGAACRGGQCVCPAGEDVCGTGFLGGECVDLASDDSDCGACGVHCGAGSCVGGACVCGESPGVVACPGPLACANTSSDPGNCGGCGDACPLLGEACVDGVCTCPAETPDVCPIRPSWEGCVALQGDPRHCGECGTVCPLNGVCAAGTCACPAGTTLCAAGSVCADLATDAANCGGCGARCDGVCVGGSCEPGPPPPESCGYLTEPCCAGLCYAGTCDGLNCWP